jgi:hypothetical protein
MNLPMARHEARRYLETALLRMDAARMRYPE